MCKSPYKTDWLVIPGTILLLVLVIGSIRARTFGANLLGRNIHIAIPALPRSVGIVRPFPTQWEATIFRPGSLVESWLTSNPVTVYALEEFRFGIDEGRRMCRNLS